MQITLVRDALADAARTIILPAGIGKLTSTGYMPDAVTAPAFYIAEYTIDFDKTYRRGLDEIEFTGRILTGRADDKSAQKILDLTLSGAGEASLKQAIEVARGAPGQAALGGLADDLHVMRVQGYRWYEHAGITYVGAELMIRVIGDGST